MQLAAVPCAQYVGQYILVTQQVQEASLIFNLHLIGLYMNSIQSATPKFAL